MSALLCKWNSCFVNESGAPWKQVISQKYGEDVVGWHSCEVRERYGVGLWKAIRKERDLFSSKLSFQVGNGQRVRFWRDKWCGDEPLCDSFPSLFAFSLSKEAWVVEVWNLEGEGGGWTPWFSRPFNDQEMESVKRFLLRLQATRVHRDVDDKVIWIAMRSGNFLVKSLYSILEPDVPQQLFLQILCTS